MSGDLLWRVCRVLVVLVVVVVQISVVSCLESLNQPVKERYVFLVLPFTNEI